MCEPVQKKEERELVQPTYHVPLVMDHDCEILEDLIHIHDVWLNREQKAAETLYNNSSPKWHYQQVMTKW